MLGKTEAYDVLPGRALVKNRHRDRTDSVVTREACRKLQIRLIADRAVVGELEVGAGRWYDFETGRSHQLAEQIPFVLVEVTQFIVMLRVAGKKIGDGVLQRCIGAEVDELVYA